jgi:hypothetical protein
MDRSAPRKRDASEMSAPPQNGYSDNRNRDYASSRNNTDSNAANGERVKKFRWDESPAPSNNNNRSSSSSSYNKPPYELRSTSHHHHSNGNSNGHQSNGLQPAQMYGPPPPVASNGTSHSHADQAKAYADYASAYNMQMYQTMASNGYQAPPPPPHPPISAAK